MGVSRRRISESLCRLAEEHGGVGARDGEPAVHGGARRLAGRVAARRPAHHLQPPLPRARRPPPVSADGGRRDVERQRRLLLPHRRQRRRHQGDAHRQRYAHAARLSPRTTYPRLRRPNLTHRWFNLPPAPLSYPLDSAISHTAH